MGPDSLIKPVGKLKPLDNSNGVKPVGKLTPISEVDNGDTDLYTQVLTAPDKMAKLNEVVANIPDLPGDSETKKKIFKDLVLKGVKGEELSGALETLAGKHPHQEGSDKYYYNDRGIPTPLKADERPPKGFDVANDLHGTQEEANQVGFLNSAGRHLYNGVLKGVLGLETLGNLPYALTTGQDADWYKRAKNRVESSLYKTPEYEHEEQLWDPKDVKDIGDILYATVNPKNYNIKANTLQGAALNGLESITSFLVGTRGLGALGKIGGAAATRAGLLAEGSILGEAGEVAKQGSKLTDLIEGTSNAGIKAHAFGGAYSITLPETVDYVQNAGVEGREKYALASAIAIPIALTEMMFGTEGLFVKNQAAKAAKSKFIQGIVDGVARDTEGKITKEALQDAFKATTSEAVKLNKSFAADLAGNVGEEALTEGFQELQKQGLTKLYDQISGENNFKQDPFSFEAFKDYYNSALGGAFGAVGPSAGMTIQKRNQEIREKQSQNIFNTVQKGDDAVNALKLNIDKAVKDGEITTEQGADAIIKVNAYHEYNKQTKDLNLKDEEKRRVFDLTFEKQNLEQGIPKYDYQEKDLSAIEQGVINAKKKQAKHLQDEIDKIILREDVQNKANVRAKKTEEEVAKDIEKEKESQVNGPYKTPEFVINEKRTYNEIPLAEWNNPKFNTRIKKYKLADHLDTTPTKSTEGTVQQDYKEKVNGHLVDTFNVTLPDGKTVRFASSMVRKPSENELGGFRGNTYEENFTDKKNPIGSKVGITVKTLKDSGRKVMFVWNADKNSPKYGKHIGMVKESLKGKSNYSDADLEEMADLRMTNMAPEGGEETTTIETPTPKGPITPADVKIVSPKVVLGQPTRENLRNKWIEDAVERGKKTGAYHPAYDKIYRDLAGQGFDKLNPTLYAEQPTKESAVTSEELTAGNNEGVNGENISEGETKKVRTGKPTSQQKIKDPKRIAAMGLTVYAPRAIIMQYFIGGGKVSFDAVKTLLNNSQKEAQARTPHMTASVKRGKKIAPNLNDLAHSLWEDNKDFTPFADVQDYKNELEDVINNYTSVVKMADDLIKAYTEQEQKSPVEEVVSEMHDKAEEEKTGAEVNAIQDKLENETNDELTKLAKDQQAFDNWEEDTDINYYDGDIQFQKSKNYSQEEIDAVKDVINRYEDVGDLTMFEVADEIEALDIEDLSDALNAYREEQAYDRELSGRGDMDAADEAFLSAIHEFIDNQESQLQKISQRKTITKSAIEKAVNVLQKAMPKMKVIYDENLKVAAYIYKDHIVINPNYAGLDTPIHEYGHVLIDSIGYNDPLIQEGIKQLKDSQLWEETAKRYPELNEEMLGKEVLAEAIGREGADVFEDVSKESKFKKWLDKIFTWFKEKLGLEKNVAKKLAKQLLRGEGTQEMEGKTTEVQKQKVKEKINSLKDKSIEDLVSEYNNLVQEGTKGKYFTEVKKQLGYKLFQTRKSEILNSPVADKFVEQLANKKDLGKKDVLFKTLSHMAEYVPELQKFSKEFDSVYFDMIEDRYKLKEELEKLGKAVIKEKNKSLGLLEKAKNLFSSDNAKYFEYLENPKANEEIDEDTGEKTYSPGYWTEEEAKAKGFTDTQIKFLNFMRKLQDLRNEQYEESGNTGNIDDVLKIDKGFRETLKTEGLLQAFSAYLGNSFAIKDADIEFTDPETNKKSVIPYGDVEKHLIKYGNKGPLQKLNAMRLMLKYNFKARRATKDKVGQFNLSPNGVLNNKFLKSRDKSRGYSKDFYKAAFNFIDDYTHTKHIGKLLPYIDAIETLNEHGFAEHTEKPNVVKWIKDWKDAHIFKNEKQGALGPEVDAGLRFLRTLTSRIVMTFNVGAAGMNLFTGLYNNWRSENWEKVKKGNARMFGKKGLNKKAKNILNKYQVVSIDYESNPKVHAGKLFDQMAYALTRMGEYYIQGSMFMGLMSDADYALFDENGNIKEGVTKEEQERLKKDMIANKNKVSDIQGKYGDKDRRNIMNSEFGKSALQFKLWMLDALKERLGAEYITADNETKKGTYRQFTIDAIKDLKNQIKQDGVKAIWNNKDAMSNLKGAMFVAALLSLRLAGDDDEKKRRQGDLLSQMLGNVAFMFDKNNIKFTLERPMASIGTLTKFVDALDYALTMEEYSGKSRFGNKGDLKVWGSIGQLLPYKKLLINDMTFPKD